MSNSKETVDTSSSVSSASSGILTTSASILPIGELSTSIAHFLQQLDTIAEQEIVKITEGRRTWESQVAEVEESNTNLNNELKRLQNRDQELAQKQAREIKNSTLLRAEIAKLKKAQEEAEFTLDELKFRLELKRETLTRKKEERAEALRLRMKRNQLKLNTYEESTCMRIYGAQEDKITFIFTQIREDKPHREHAFTVDVSQGQYKVTECFPRLKELDRIVEWVNSNGDFYTFLKTMRNAFSENYQSRNSTSTLDNKLS